MIIDEVEFYDATTNQLIDELTDPKYCRTPIGIIRVKDSAGKEHAASLPIPIITRQIQYKRTYWRGLRRRKMIETRQVREFNFKEVVIKLQQEKHKFLDRTQ